MNVTPTPIDGLFVAHSNRIGDERGSFMRLYCAQTLGAAGIKNHIPVQINHSVTRQTGTLRGLHYQHAPALEGKIGRCIRGRIFDVAVDLRAGSKTFLQHHTIELSADNHQAFIIPPGCAHGFQTLEDDCELIYLHSAAYNPALEAGVRYNDAQLNIRWPRPVTLLSDRDAGFASLASDFTGVTVDAM